MPVRILLVDDEPDILHTLQQALQENLGLPAEVETAATGEEAQARLADPSRHYDLVLADEKMPGMRGTQLLEWLRTTRPRTLRVLMTAFREGYIAEDAVNRARIHLFLAKPFDLGEMMGVVRRALVEAGAGTRPDAPRA